ncbi:hypothetical protein EDB83DRAFT_2322295 [Lactarius deliciosus]|nr:hypothetical protein EDB83DRAFT_2322295 [Lactarius deliciosus]
MKNTQKAGPLIRWVPAVFPRCSRPVALPPSATVLATPKEETVDDELGFSPVIKISWYTRFKYSVRPAVFFLPLQYPAGSAVCSRAQDSSRRRAATPSRHHNTACKPPQCHNAVWTPQEIPPRRRLNTVCKSRLNASRERQRADGQAITATSSDEDDSDDDREFVLAIEGERERIDHQIVFPPPNTAHKARAPLIIGADRLTIEMRRRCLELFLRLEVQLGLRPRQRRVTKMSAVTTTIRRQRVEDRDKGRHATRHATSLAPS